MEYSLGMVFVTSSGKKATFSVNGIKDANIPGADIKALMNTMITENIFTTPAGDLVKIDSAHFTSKTVSKIDLA